MPIPLRLIDSGLRAGRLQVAYHQALVDLHTAGTVADSLRFFRCQPTAFVGRHQAVAHAIRVEDCFADAVDIARRMTGGGAMYLDQHQVGWELVVSRERLATATLQDCIQLVGDGIAAGLSHAFGIEARLHGRGDIDVGGKMLGDVQGFVAGTTLVLWGTVPVDIDPTRVMSYFYESETDTPVTLKTLLGVAPSLDALQTAIRTGLEAKLGFVAMPAEMSAAEHQLAQTYHDDHIGTDAFVFSIDEPRDPTGREASHTGLGGTATVFLHVEGHGPQARIRDCVFTGDFVVTPPRLMRDLEAALKGLSTLQAALAVHAFFATSKPDMITMPPEDFARVIATAVKGA